MSRYRFALSRRWLLAHAGILVFASLCVVAGRWQLHRLDEKRAHNRTLVARLTLPLEPAATLLNEPATAAYRRAEASGTYDTAREIVLTNRSLGGRDGSHLLTPLVLDNQAILVDRGWVPLTAPDQAFPQASPPSGRVTVTGILLPTERGLGTAIPGAGPHPEVSHVDLAKIGTRMPCRLAPLYLRLQAQSPPQPGGLPTPAPVEKLDEGPHLSYAVQWFIFATIALVGYAFVVRKAARDRAN